MTITSEIMTPDTRDVMAHHTVQLAAEAMTCSGVNALPVYDQEHRLLGMITDRDIVLKVMGAGKDPNTTTVGQIATRHTLLIGATEEVGRALQIMNTHQVRRAPVVQGHRLVGTVSNADLARVLPNPQLGDLLHALSAD